MANQVKGYIELRGHGPKRIIIDRPRDADSVKWGMVENLKNGYVPALPATPTLPPAWHMCRKWPPNIYTH